MDEARDGFPFIPVCLLCDTPFPVCKYFRKEQTMIKSWYLIVHRTSMEPSEHSFESQEQPSVIARAIHEAYAAPARETVSFQGREFPVQNAALFAFATAQARTAMARSTLEQFRNGLSQ
jgi:hypothetical protein